MFLAWEKTGIPIFIDHETLTKLAIDMYLNCWGKCEYNVCLYVINIYCINICVYYIIIGFVGYSIPFTFCAKSPFFFAHHPCCPQHLAKMQCPYHPVAAVAFEWVFAKLSNTTGKREKWVQVEIKFIIHGTPSAYKTNILRLEGWDSV